MGTDKAIQVDAGMVAESEADIRKTLLRFFGVHISPWVSGSMRMGMVMWKEQSPCSCFWRLLLSPRWCTNEAKNQDIDNWLANSISLMQNRALRILYSHFSLGKREIVLFACPHPP